MTRILVLAGLSGLLVAAVVFLVVNPPGPVVVGPNLVVILVDTMRADHLGYMGYTRATSPRLDQLAASSVVFARHYSNASRTGPSVASLFTGLHPPSHGVVNPITLFDAKGTLASGQTTLAEILHDRRYRCGGFTANLNISDRFGFGQGFDVYEWVRPIGQGGGLGGPASVVNAAALAWLSDAERPFFLYLHYLDPHSPYDAPPPYDALFIDPDYSGSFTGSHRQLDEVVAGTLVPIAADMRHLVDLYDQEIAYVDALIGELLDALEEAGILEDTIIAVLSDHGEEFYDHGSVLHGYTLYEEQLHLPLLIRDPLRPGPRRVERITRQVDLLPTLLELLDVDYAGRIEGRSLVPFMDEGTVEEAPRPVYALASLKAVKTVERESLLQDGWKLIRSRRPAPAEELYDLAADPGEHDNLVEARPDQAQRMRDALDRMRESFVAAPVDSVSLTAEERERLRSVGYIQ